MHYKNILSLCGFTQHPDKPIFRYRSISEIASESIQACLSACSSCFLMIAIFEIFWRYLVHWWVLAQERSLLNMVRTKFLFFCQISIQSLILKSRYMARWGIQCLAILSIFDTKVQWASIQTYFYSLKFFLFSISCRCLL